MLVLQPWSSEFRPSQNFLPRTCLLLHLLDLPLVFWSPSALERIVSNVGSLMHLDESTELLSKGRFARVVVEVDLSNPFLPGTEITIEDSVLSSFWQPLSLKVSI